MINLEKYVNKYRVILISISDNKNILYKKIIEDITKYKKKFDLLSTVIKFVKNEKFNIKLIGMDGKVKYQNNTYTGLKILIDLINEMPMQKNISKLTLYADYHPSTSNKNFGFKNKDIALKTIKLIKNLDKKYQFLIINTMYNRAKYHPYQTKEMREAMKIFKKWLLLNKNT